MEKQANKETPQAEYKIGSSPWGYAYEVALCEQCDWSYVVPAGVLPQTCPHCFRGRLHGVVELQPDELFYTHPPELILPFKISETTLSERINTFTSGIPFPPSDLKVQNLASRLKRVYLPYWLVDVEVNATWELETGFDYQVVSHQDYYDQYRGGWHTKEVKEGRIRWEQRLGRLARIYHNVSAAALEEEAELAKSLGKYDIGSAEPYHTDLSTQAFVRLPNSSPEDAWPRALPAVQTIAAEECRRAAEADHQRNFRWAPEFKQKNWTYLLRPVYTTYYLDDESHPQPVFINGQSGHLSGVRSASMKRAQQTALWILGAALLICLLSVIVGVAGIFFPPVLIIGVIGFILAVIIGLGAIVPIAVVWNFNRNQPAN